MATLFTAEKFQVVGPNGPIPGAQVFTYAAGTLTPLATFTNQGGLSANTNPVITGADGRASIWMGSSTYRFRVFDSVANGGALIDDVDNIVPYATVADVAAGTAGLTAFEAQLAASTNTSQGAALLGFSPTLNYVAKTLGAALLDGYLNALWFITLETERAAIKAYTSTTDHTALLNTIIGYGKRMYVPAGLWNVDTDVGLVLPAGGSIVGDGIMRTIFKAAAHGGTVGDLQAYTKGSVIKRAFTPAVPNLYVTGCYLADFSVQLNHPTYNASNYRQIGVDMRNITRSVIERVHSGTTGVPGQPVCPAPNNTDMLQGYGFVFGTLSGSDVAYCGGEVNIMRDCLAWGAYKNITIDDAVLSPLSGAHGTKVVDTDVQGGHQLISQELPYAAGVEISGVTIQGTLRQSGNVDPTVGIMVAGYNCDVDVKYAEMGVACDTLFIFTSASHNSKAKLNNYSFDAPSTGSITDTGTRNRLEYNAGTVSGTTTLGFGKPVVLYNKAPLSGGYKGAWNGTGFTVDMTDGSSVTKVSAAVGDYWFNLDTPQPNSTWIPSGHIDSDASAHFGGIIFDATTQSASRIRFYTYTQVGGSTAPVDPRRLYLSFRQAT